jgi:ribosomal-protein-alanine N-acetyltransferase
MNNEIVLLQIDHALASDVQEGRDAFEQKHGVRIMTDLVVVREVIRQTLALLAAHPRDTRWGGYLVVDPGTSTVVGTCGFKTGPTDEGVVEIAYFTFPEFEGQGFATAMAARLKRLAGESAAVQRIIAYTLPERNPSTRILEKIGMQFTGEVDDPEDGLVWRWECSPAERAPSA